MSLGTTAKDKISMATARYKPRFSDPEGPSYRLTFTGFLSVRLMEFDYNGKHYSYHGKKLENAVKRLTEHNFKNATTSELVIHGQAVYDWKQMERDSRDAAQAEVCSK